MPELELLRPDHAPALLRFELNNRAYVASRVGDRGDDFFADFEARYRALLDEQAAGACRFHVLVEGDGGIGGRVNLADLADGAAELGYRIVERATGRGLATTAVLDICDLAATEYGLSSLRATAAVDNPASQAVLAKAGFVRAGTEEADGLLHFLCDLSVERSRR